MPPFRLRKDARKWFRELYSDKSFSIGFDAFYFCFIAGICAKIKEEVTQDKTDELVAYFPDRYRSRGNLLVALFLKRELEEFGVKFNDKEEVRTRVSQLVSSNSPNHLSDDGVREFNKYAHAGFEVLLDWFDDSPRTLETFLRIFKKKVSLRLAADKQ